MKTVLFTRMLLLKKQALSLFIWLVMPLFLTVVLVQWLNDVASDGQIPIAIVDEDDSAYSQSFIEELQQIDVLNIQLMTKQKALYALEKNQIDSAFIIKRKFEEQLRNNKRNQLIEAYSTNRSYFYFAVKENISSLAQQKATQAKAAYEVKKLLTKYESTISWSFDEIVAASQEREERYELLSVEFSYLNPIPSASEKPSLLNPWAIWAFLSLISTFYLLDWVIKEANQAVIVRWLQSKIAYVRYFFSTLSIYLIFMLFMDVLTYRILEEQFIWSDVLALLAFRICSVALALLFAVHMKNVWGYYAITPLIAFLVAFVGGAFIPMEQLVIKWPVLSELSPVFAFLQWEVSLVWLIITILSLLYVYRKELSRFA